MSASFESRPMMRGLRKPFSIFSRSHVAMQASNADDMEARLKQKEEELLKKEKELAERERLIELEEKIKQKEKELDER